MNTYTKISAVATFLCAIFLAFGCTMPTIVGPGAQPGMATNMPPGIGPAPACPFQWPADKTFTLTNNSNISERDLGGILATDKVKIHPCDVQSTMSFPVVAFPGGGTVTGRIALIPPGGTSVRYITSYIGKVSVNADLFEYVMPPNAPLAIGARTFQFVSPFPGNSWSWSSANDWRSVMAANDTGSSFFQKALDIPMSNAVTSEPVSSVDSYVTEEWLKSNSSGDAKTDEKNFVLIRELEANIPQLPAAGYAKL